MNFKSNFIVGHTFESIMNEMIGGVENGNF